MNNPICHILCNARIIIINKTLTKTYGIYCTSSINELRRNAINEYTKKHYFKQIGEEYINEIEEKHINDMKASFVTSYINIEQYLYYLEYEYYLLYDLKQNDVEQTLEEYYNMRAPYYALYEFFKSKNLVTERSNNE